MMAWTAERKASLKGSAAAAFASLLDQVMWHRLISPCQCAGIAILLVCSAIAVWKFLDRAELNDEDMTFLKLYPGDNLFRYDAETGLDNLVVNIYRQNKYLGV